MAKAYRGKNIQPVFLELASNSEENFLTSDYDILK